MAASARLPKSAITIEIRQRIVMTHPKTGEISASNQNTPENETGTSWTAIIEKVAAALDVAPNVFALPHTPDADRVRVLAENDEALELFAGITDRDARQRGRAYLRWIACNLDPEKDPRR
jgi:hypothetical protein